MEHMHKGFKMLLQFVNNRKKWQKVMFFLSCVVVFVTTYALILPAITLEQQATENEAGIILGTDDVFLPDGYDTPAPDNVQYSDTGIIDGQNTDVPENTDANDIDELFTDGANDPADGDADDTVNDGTEDLVSSDIASETIDYSAEDSSPLFNEYDTQDGNTLRVSVSYGEDAEIPQGAELITTEICQDTEASDTETEYDRYLSEAADALGCDVASIKYARFFNISIVDSNGEEIQPAEGSVAHVSVSLEDEAVENEALSVVHFGEQTDVMDTTVDAESIRFETTGFSVYAFIETVLEKTVLTSDGYNYEIRAAYDAESGIPADAELSVEEITDGFSVYGKSYEEYVADTEHALDIAEGTTEYIRLFDISIVDKNDHSIKYQPAEGSSVEVTIELADSQHDNLNVVHFADENDGWSVVDTWSLADTDTDWPTVIFDADSFSVYSIVEAPPPVSFDPNKLSTVSEIEENKAYVFSYDTPEKYFTAALNNNGALIESSESGDAAEWYFEKVSGADNTYYIYTLDNGVKQYIRQKNNGNEIQLAASGTAFNLSDSPTANKFYFKHSSQGRYLQHSKSGEGIRFYTDAKDATNSRIFITEAASVRPNDDPYGLDGQTYGIAYNDESVTAAAMTNESKKVSGVNRLAGQDMLIRPDVLNSEGVLLVAADSGITEWTFENDHADKYYISTIVDGEIKYLKISGAAVSLTDSKDDASLITATPGTETYSGKWHFTSGGYSLNLFSTADNGFGAATGDGATTWLNLVERSPLEDEDFNLYKAKKVSVSDPVNVSDGQEIVIYTRVWNDTTKKYEYYAVDHDGSLVRCYDNGDSIEWIGSQVNTSVWEFTEGKNPDGTSNDYYYLQNTTYGGYLLPQMSNNQTVYYPSDGTTPDGIDLVGRRNGEIYTKMIVWDDDQYSYSGFKVEDGRIVPCPLAEAEDFYFAVINPKEERILTEVETIDNNDYGITMKMVDFNNPKVDARDSVQTPFFGAKDNNVPGMLSTDLNENGYPTTTNKTGHNVPLSDLFTGMTDVNHLFIENAYNEGGYFEYDSTQNFAHLNENGNFTVYDQLLAVGTSAGVTRTHGQFLPYNMIDTSKIASEQTHNPTFTNRTDVSGNELPDANPRKGEELYWVAEKDADYFFGMEMEASFTQTVNGLDTWGHDIIFEFSGDDDFWFYVDGELVLDLGGVHSAMSGSINFRTGEVKGRGGTSTTLYDVFRSNYQARGMTEAEINQRLDEIFEEKVVDGQTVRVFTDYTNHTMKMFYMERGAGASNLHMRFNLAAIRPGTVVLNKKLSGTASEANSLIEFPYQIWYTTEEDGGKSVLHRLGEADGDKDLVTYKNSVKKVTYKKSFTSLTGTEYEDVFFLKPGQSAVIDLPDNTIDYRIVECNVNSSVYDSVKVNGTELTGTEVEDTGRKDFATSDASMEQRPEVNFNNHVSDGAMRTLSVTKKLYDTDGTTLLHYDAEEGESEDKTTFDFRLYLGDENADASNLPAANIYSYFVKNRDGYYCRWNAAGHKFEPLPYTEYEGSNGLGAYLNTLTGTEKEQIIFKTSRYGAISKIPADYTVEVRDLIVGSQWKAEERENEIPKGYTLRLLDGYTRTDEGYEKNTQTVPISGVLHEDEDPKVFVSNQKGWGLTVEKIWTDKDFMESHDDIYFAVYYKNSQGEPTELISDTVYRLSSSESEIYWFFDQMQMGGRHFSDFCVREVTLTGDNISVDENGLVTGYDTIDPIADGGSLTIGGTPTGGVYHPTDDSDTGYTYTVTYEEGEQTVQNENVRTDTVTNSRAGIKLYKKKLDGDVLGNVVFTLTDEEGENVAANSYTSRGSDGLITIAYLNPGSYYLTETATPKGYVAPSGALAISVAEDGNITVTGPDSELFEVVQAEDEDMAVITVKNRPVDLQVKKIDASTREAIEGAHFSLYLQVTDASGNVRKDYTPWVDPASGTDYSDLVSDENGLLQELTINLPNGTYYLTETEPAEGYDLLMDDICFTIGNDGKVTVNSAGHTSWLTSKIDDETGTVSYTLAVPNGKMKKLSFRKVDIADTDHGLPGAEFDLYPVDETEGQSETAYISGLVSDSDGMLSAGGKTVFDIPFGTYHLIETEAPDDYIKKEDPVVIHVTEAQGEHGVNYDEGTSLSSDGGLTYDETTGVYTLKISNTKGYVLPSTGGQGTKLFTACGAVMILLSGILLLMRRRCS